MGDLNTGQGKILFTLQEIEKKIRLPTSSPAYGSNLSAKSQQIFIGIQGITYQKAVTVFTHTHTNTHRRI